MEAIADQQAKHWGSTDVLMRAASRGVAEPHGAFDGGARPAATWLFASRRLVLRPGNAAGLNCRTPLKEFSYGSS